MTPADMSRLPSRKPANTKKTKPVDSRRERCLGRDRELAQLMSCFEDARGRQGTFVLVSGKPGIGKSTLLFEAQRQLRDRGALVLEGRCRPGLLSFRPLLEVARAALEHLCSAGASEDLLLVGEQLLETLGGRSQDATPPATRIGFFDQMARLLQAVSDLQPVVVTIHDLDFADAGTLQLLRYLGRVLTASPELPRGRFRGLLLANAGDRTVIPDDDGWSRGVNLLSIDLDGLDAVGVKAFLASDDVVERVLQATRGVPQLMEHILGDGLEGRGLDMDLEVHLEELEPSERRILNILAVFGRPLGPETLRLLSQLPQDGLARGIASLSQRQVIEKMVVDGELRICFSRAGDQRAVYGAIDAQKRRKLHREIGRHLASREDELEACAHHLLLGQAGARAVKVALSAGARLERAFSFERAAELYERALEVTGAGAEVRETLVDRLCQVYEVTGKLDRALHHAEARRAERPEDPEWGLRIAHLHLTRGDFAAAREELGRLRDAEGELGIRVLADRAWAQYLAGENNAAVTSAEEGLARCGESSDDALSPIRIGLNNTLGKVCLEQDRYDDARGLFLANLDQARAFGLPAEEVRALVQLGQTSLQLGNHEHAEDWYRQARELAAAIGEHRYLGACLQHLGVLAERRRDFGRALELYQDAVSAWKKVGHRSYLAWVGIDLGKLYLQLGDVSRATAMAELAERLSDNEPPAATRINLELLRGRIAAHECRFVEAERRFTRARDLARTAGQPEREARAQLDLAALALDRSQLDDAHQVLFDEMKRPPQGSLRVQAALLQARVHIERGELDQARSLLADALEQSDLQNDGESSWQARFLLSAVARRQGRTAEARRRLKEAASFEARVRGTVPEEFREAFAEQGPRVALRRALGTEESPSGCAECPAPPERPAGFGPIVGHHPRMLQIFDHAQKVAPTDALVLIRGESGTGKELIAEAIHRMSERASRPLVKVNCGALVESLLLSELFGHERGAFTGALQRRKGRFEVAEGGTIFLDEIGDISPKTQVALLRVLQNKEFERVGGTEPIRVDVRIICATNRDLEAMVRAGTFREDLYYRLRGVLIEVPPLRERAEDIRPLADHFLARIARERESGSAKRLSPAAEKLLRSHRWPGNVRELENVLRSVSLFTDAEVLDVQDFIDYPELRESIPAEDGSGLDPGGGPPGGSDASDQEDTYAYLRASGISLKDLKKEIEARCISEALSEARGNITRAADLLGMKRPRLSQLIKEHGLSAGGAA
jgi:transcriptional regulator with GAF, ATPase, and Fis domain/Flp pilus assembly protein TadD